MQTSSVIQTRTAIEADYRRALTISDRRLAALRGTGDDVRNTIAWRDAVYERSMIAFRRSYGRCTKGWH